MTFAEQLRQLRERAGLTQAALAVASGLSLGVIRDYEQEKKEPTLRSAVKLAAALGVGVDVFAGSVGGEEATQKPAAPRPAARKRKEK
jgi:transcriptional regulator with XRE-family HTH domain